MARINQEVFPGSPTVKNGYAYVNEAPGLGVDLNEALAAKFATSAGTGNWLPVRRRDGTSVTPQLTDSVAVRNSHISYAL